MGPARALPGCFSVAVLESGKEKVGEKWSRRGGRGVCSELQAEWSQNCSRFVSRETTNHTAVPTGLALAK
jgi:hypothetical protein